VANRGLCAQAQCESIKHKLVGGLAVRRAAYGVMRLIMESGAKGCEITVSGKLRGARAKGMTFREGYMIKSGGSKRGKLIQFLYNSFIAIFCRICRARCAQRPYAPGYARYLRQDHAFP
jgi:hypothetical protein